MRGQSRVPAGMGFGGERCLAGAVAALVVVMTSCGSPGDEVITTDLFDADWFEVPTTPATPTWSSPGVSSFVEAQRAGVIAVFEDPAAALDAGRRVHAVLVEAAEASGAGDDIAEVPFGAPSAPPPSEPEIAFLAELGLADPERGFGWLGKARGSGAAVSVIGAVVTVSDLAFVADDPITSNPLHEAFVALGATRTVGELDWVEDLGAAADVACVTAEPVPAEELRELADYLSATVAYDVTAPWDEPLNAESQRLRRSLRILQERLRVAARTMLDDPAKVAEAVDEAVRAGEDPVAVVRSALADDGSIDPAILDGLDPVVVGWFLEDQLPAPADPADERRLRAERRAGRSAALGAPPVDPTVSGVRPNLGRIGFSAWRIDITANSATVRLARVESNSLARALPRMVDHLDGIGCTDVTVEIIDLDRG